MSSETPAGAAPTPLADVGDTGVGPAVPPPGEPPAKKGGGWKPLGELVATIVVAIAIAWIVQAYVVKPYRIPSASMEQTLKPGDRVLVARFIYDFTDPSRGDILVFHPPGVGDQPISGAKTEASVNYIKRLIGLPGETVEGRQGKVWICRAPRVGCRALVEPYVNGPTRDFGPITVPQGQYFMMGDNRDDSEDSREWGTLPQRNVLGEAFSTYWPPLRIGLLF